jgi:hypothetical protein
MIAPVRDSRGKPIISRPRALISTVRSDRLTATSFYKPKNLPIIDWHLHRNVARISNQPPPDFASSSGPGQSCSWPFSIET